MGTRGKTRSRKMPRGSWTIVWGGVAVAGLALGFSSASFASGRTDRQAQAGRKSTDAPVAARGKLGQDLFLAIDHGDLGGLKSLLKEGADPNATNGLEFRPLYIAAASHQVDAMKALLAAGAKVDAHSTYGTPLLFAAATGNVDGVHLLLERGADPNTIRTDGMSALMMAANVGAVPIVQELLQRKVDVKAQDDGGATALTLAARCGSVPTGSLLLSAGADIDGKDVEGQTPLMEAAVNGHVDFVQMLLKSGAKPDVRDEMGRTALIRTAEYGDRPEVIRALLDGGANPKATDKKGESALALALRHGYTETAALLGGGNAGTFAAAMLSPRAAIDRSLKLMQASMLQFNESTSCVSCHQEGIGRIATGEARAHGFHLDPVVQKAQTGRISGMVAAMRPLHEGALKNPEVMKQVPLIEINEVSTMYTWVLSGMAAQNQPANESTAAMAMVLARQQSPEGCWTFSVPRVPLQSSPFTFTALAVRALQAYGPKAEGAEIAERIGKAREWLLHATPQNSEDRASRLLGLKWTGADASAKKEAADAILADQRPDGGWAQLPELQSDAYATGQALYALHVGEGLPASDTVYKHGVQFLLRTQDSDGSWFVSKRAIPANNYFDAGFPHGESQYASFNATSYATLALLQTIEPKAGQVARR